MADAGEIKAKVTIEYDGSGLEKAKEDLASLAEAGGTVGDSMGKAGTSVSEVGDQFAQSAISAGSFSEGLKAIEAPASRGAEVVSQLSDAFAGGQVAISEVGNAFEALGSPLESSVSLLEAAPAPMAAISQHAQSMSEQLSSAGDGFVQIQESLAQSVPLLPQYAESIQSVGKAMGSDSFGVSGFSENMAVFQDALENPYPFSMIQSHLDETGQTWNDFTSSIGDNNASMLHEMATTSDVSHQVLGGIASDAQSVGTSFQESADSTKAFTDQFGGLNAVATDINDTMKGTGTVMEDVGKAAESAGIGGVFSDIGGALGDAFSGIAGSMGSLMMPLMAAPMVAMAIGSVATGIYNAAAVAEGPGAHGIGTFTGAVDALGQTAAKSSQTFSESFGQAVIPTLDAINYSMSQAGGTSGIGTFLGGTLSTLTNIGQIAMGGLFMSSGVGAGIGIQMAQGGMEGLVNQGASFLGMSMPFQGPGVTKDYSAMNAQLLQQAQQNIAMASDPQYMATQQTAAYLQYKTQQAVQQVAMYDVSHWSGSTGFKDPNNAIVQGEMIRSTGQSGGGIDPNAAYFYGLLGQAPYTNETAFGSGGCFPAGTRVLMVNGSEKPIETLQVGDQVIGHDDTRPVSTVVLARIVPPPKQTYELIFSDGNTLTLTDSHPIATTQGWKSLSPEHTKEENPDLSVATLQIGDHTYTADGTTCTLTTIQTREVIQVYNITVGEPHTFYANGVLVHNKVNSTTTGSQPLGSQIADQIQSIQLPQMDLSKLGSSLAGNFGNIEIPQIHANVSWAVSGELNKVWQTVSSWSLSGELEKAWQAASSWSLSGELEKIWQSMSSWSLSGELNKVWQTVSSWNLMGDLEKAWNAVSSWNLTGDLEKMWHGIATWTAEGLEHTFNAVANWVASNLNPVFNVAATFIGLPGFATGVENFSGGAAIVGENGPELVTLPSGSSVYPMTVGPGVGSTATLGGGSSGSGGGTPQSVNISVNLDSQTFIQALGIPLANSIRVGMGQRGY